MHIAASWLEHYGYGVLFIALCLELMALPLPGEMLMGYAGLFVFEKKLNWMFCIVAAGSGVIAGISLSYWVGHLLGRPFLRRYGARIHMGEEQLAKMSVWFEKYGNKLLLVSFFIPGVRHVTGYFCGVTHLPFRKYAAYAYWGGLLWVSLFISLGTFIGPKWEQYQAKVNRYMLIFVLASVVVTVIVYLVRKYKDKVLLSLRNLFKTAINYVYSYGRSKFLALTALTVFLVFVGCLSVILIMIQSFLAAKFSD